MDDVPVVHGRQCGACNMCCKLMEVTELEKQMGEWCEHVLKRRGCAIYGTRPSSCAAFHCGYLIWPLAGNHWLPSKCKMVIVIEDETRMAIHVDPATPNIWRSEPYYSDLKLWARQATQHDQQLVISIARRMIALLPDCEIDLGFVGDDEVVLTGRFADGRYGARKFNADDPAIRGMEYGKPYTSRR